MQRDVKVGLVLGVLLVAVVAVVFFRRDEDDRDKFAKLLPAPDAVAGRARDILGPSPTDPYPVAPEYLTDSWQTPKSKSGRTPTPARNKNGEVVAQIESVEGSGSNTRSGNPVSAVLQPPELESSRGSARTKPEPLNARVRAPGSDARSSSAGDYVIQDGDTLSEIARRQMGSALLWTEIYKENEDVLKDPANIPAGQKIRIPAGNKQHEAVVPPRPARNTQETATSQEPAGSYVVKDGDTLTRIARKHYGQESMYLEILRANSHQIENPAGIYPGMVLRLP